MSGSQKQQAPDSLANTEAMLTDVDRVFSVRLLSWFDQHGRHDLPWQHPRSPYFVWLSEVMLQQTQVATVKAYFTRFVTRFPTLPDLAAASLDDVLSLWAGLGYYSRARNLHACAKRCVLRHAGTLPMDREQLQALPGIGRSTAAAILAQAFEQKAAILDGNVKRILARVTATLEWPGLAPVERALWHEAERRLPDARFADYTQALMDLGATVCAARAPKCPQCPVSDGCLALSQALTSSIPAKRQKKARPTRFTNWLLVRDAQDRVLLMRRPELGIWGGLYCLPEASDVADFFNQALPLENLVLHAPMPDIRHVFTHFSLIATPVRAYARAAVGLSEPGSIWVNLLTMQQIGLPSPVRRLLEQIFSSTDND
jgi:A/G-specific adenine glycosylase